MDKRMVARWESRGGKTWIELYADQWGYSYRGNDCGGNRGALADDAAAIADIEGRLEWLTPDAHKNLLKRVR